MKLQKPIEWIAILFSVFVGATSIEMLNASTKGTLPTPSPAPHVRRVTSQGLVATPLAPVKLPKATHYAAFAAGCFWGVEQEFRKTPGVIATAVGFEGGHTPDPTYAQVSNDTTGHAETVLIEYDPKVVSYDSLLSLFWELHDPTTPNQQGPDVGSQYRSMIFYFNPDQKRAALGTRDKLQGSGDLAGARIVTEIVPASKFTKAEEYHQQYVEKGGRAQCHFRKKRS